MVIIWLISLCLNRDAFNLYCKGSYTVIQPKGQTITKEIMSETMQQEKRIFWSQGVKRKTNSTNRKHWLSELTCKVSLLDPVVQKPISTNPGLNF